MRDVRAVHAFVEKHRYRRQSNKVLHGHPSPVHWAEQDIAMDAVLRTRAQAHQKIPKRVNLYVGTPYCLPTDPDRCGLIPAVYDDDFGYEKYLDWVIHIPMFFVKRKLEFVPVENFTFADFLERGFFFEGEHHLPTIADFELHLSTLFPEARLKKFIEVRSADAGPPEMAVALPALCKGLFYHEPSLRKTNEKYEKMKLKNMKNTLKLLRNLVVQSFEITWKELSWNGLD